MCLCIFESRKYDKNRACHFYPDKLFCFSILFFSFVFFTHSLASNNFVFIIIRCIETMAAAKNSLEEYGEKKIFLIKHDTTSCKLTFEKRLNMQQLIFHTNFSHYEHNFPSALCLMHTYALIYIDLTS